MVNSSTPTLKHPRDQPLPTAQSLPKRLANALTWYMKLWRDDPLLQVLVVMMLAVRVLNLWAYPFLIGGDGVNYFHMLRDGHSSLIHASGYCWVFQPLAMLSDLLRATTGSDLFALEYVLRFVQPAISLTIVVVLYLAMRRLLPRALCFVMCLVIGTDALLVTATTTSQPEWLQAHLVLLVVAVMVLAATSVGSGIQYRYYLAGGAAAVLAYLCKYNALPCVVLLALPVVDPVMNRLAKLKAMAAVTMGGLAVYLLFLFSFHYPTTGTPRLNLEHGWIHTQKLGYAGIPIAPNNGIATQKYLVLIDQLEPTFAGPGPWESIDRIDPAARQAARERYQPLLEASDPAEVRRLFEAAKPALPPARDPYDPNTFTTIYASLGLYEAEQLLGQMFREGVMAHPGKYFKNVRQTFWNAIQFQQNYQGFHPLWGAAPPDHFDQAGWASGQAGDAVFMTGNSTAASKWRQVIWTPGAKVMGWLTLGRIPSALLVGAMIVGLPAIVWRLISGGKPTLMQRLYVLVLMALLGLFAFSALVYVFRNKELVLAMPLVYLAMGLSVASWHRR